MNRKTSQLVIEILPFDTAIFGIKCGKIKIMSASVPKKNLKRVLEKVKEQQIEHLVTKVPSEWVAICNLLEDFKFRFKVCSLYLEKRIAMDISKGEDIFLYDRDDDNRLIEITEKAFSSDTRFHFEQKFSPIQIVELYKRWISNLINDKNVQIYVHRDRDVITGYVVVKIENNTSRRGHIGLFAIDKVYHGKGIGSKLLSALDSILCNEIDVLSVATESINYGALKTYFKNGFTIKKSWNIFHFTSI